MKAIILTAAFLMTSFIGKSQFVKEVKNNSYVQKEWYEISGADFDGVKYITSDEVWIKSYLEDMLSQDSISIKKPDVKQIKNGRIVYMAWEYEKSDGKKVFVSYVYNSMYSCDISVQYID
jgi:hypothetical protein